MSANHTAALQLQQRLEAAFKAAPALAAGNILANRDKPLAPAERAGVRLYLIRSVAEREGLLGAPRDWQTTFHIECLARAADPAADPAAAVDALLQDAWARALALSADDLCVSEIRAATEIAWDYAEGETAVARARFALQIGHRAGPDHLTPA